MPERIQLSRRKGWRKPSGAVVVARPHRWGNPYSVDEFGRAGAIAMYRRDLENHVLGDLIFERIREELAGRDLACWCPLDQACHADVLLEIANGEASE